MLRPIVVGESGKSAALTPDDGFSMSFAIDFASDAINRQDIIDKVFGGDAVYSSIIPPGYGDWPLAEVGS